MTKEKELKERYLYLKDIYCKAMQDAKKMPRDSLEYYELMQSLSALKYEIYKIRMELLSPWQRINPLNLLDSFICDDQKEIKGR